MIRVPYFLKVRMIRVPFPGPAIAELLIYQLKLNWQRNDRRLGGAIFSAKTAGSLFGCVVFPFSQLTAVVNKTAG